MRLKTISSIFGFVCLILISFSPTAFGDVNARALLLYGGDVLETHTYFENARQLLIQIGIGFDSRAIDESITFTQGDTGQYSVIVISDYRAYLELGNQKRQTLDDYCKYNDVGQIFLFVYDDYELNDGEITILPNGEIYGQTVRSQSGVLYLTKDGGALIGMIPYYGRLLVPAARSDNYVAVANAHSGSDSGPSGANFLLDKGGFDGIQRIFISHDFADFWLHDLLFIDSIRYLSPADFGISKKRYVGVDIDDVFQPNYAEEEVDKTVKMQEDDVEALADLGEQIGDTIGSDFHFTLGFNTGWFGVQCGDVSYDDAAGDQAFLDNREEFYWFDHFPNHDDARLLDYGEIEALMNESLQWAQENDVADYMTAFLLPPFNGGIYPIHPPLYDALESLGYHYSASVDILEGFEHKGVRVAPRQTCGLDAEMYLWSEISQEEIDWIIEGGGIFYRVLHSPVLLFVSHQSNFARDRLGNYLFENMFDFFTRWTNFEFTNATNDEMIDTYFELVLGIDDDDDDDDDNDNDSADDDDDNDDDDDSPAQEEDGDDAADDSSGCGC